MVLAKKIDTYINGTEYRDQKLTHINIVKWSLTKKQRFFSEDRTVFLTNGTGTIAYPDLIKKGSTHRLYVSQKLTQINHSKMQNYKLSRRQQKRKSTWPCFWWCLFRYNIKSMIYERKE